VVVFDPSYLCWEFKNPGGYEDKDLGNNYHYQNNKFYSSKGQLVPFKLIDANPYLGQDKKIEMVKYLLEKFRFAQQARSSQIEGKYKNWLDNYAAKPFEEVRTTPWYRASNFVPQLIRMHCDIMTARMVGIMFGTKPFWKPTSALDIMPRLYLEALSMWMEFETFHRMDFYRPVRSGISRTFKTGTNIHKAVWKDPAVFSYSVAVGVNGANGLESKRISKEGLMLTPVPFEDFFPYPITVSNLDSVQIKFHRLRFTKEQVEYRAAQGIWAKEPAEFMLRTNGDYKPEGAKESQAQDAGITLTKDVTMPFTALECWFEYTMSDGMNYRLVAILNPFVDKPENALLRFFFNFDSRGEDPFVDQRFAERDDFFYGYSIPEILEQTQEEAAQIHNSRRDSNTIANTPTFKKKRLADVPNPANYWYPGMTFELDAMDDLDMMATNVNYNSMIEEEGFLQGLASTYTGISAPQQTMGGGVLEGKRGIYSAQGTMAMLQEGNDRPNLYLREFREPMHKIGRLMFRSHRDLRSTPIPFSLWGKYGQYLQNVFALPEPPDYDPVFFAIGASDGGANKEIDRTNLLLMANTMAGYYNQLTQAVSVAATQPEGSPIRETLLLVLDGAKDLADRLLFVFDIGDRKKLIPDVRDVLGGGDGSGGQYLPTSESGANEAGLPQSEEAVPISGIQNLARSISSLPH